MGSTVIAFRMNVEGYQDTSPSFGLNDDVSVIMDYLNATYPGASPLLWTTPFGLQVQSNGRWTVEHVVEELQRIPRARRDEWCVEKNYLFVYRAGSGRLVYDSQAEDGSIPDNMVVRSANPIWKMHTAAASAILRRSNERCPTFGNCGLCFSCGPLGDICPTCSGERNFTSGLELDQVRFAMFRMGGINLTGIWIVDAEQLARANIYNASIYPVRNDWRVHWISSPPCVKTFMYSFGDLSCCTSEYKDRFYDCLSSDSSTDSSSSAASSRGV